MKATLYKNDDFKTIGFKVENEKGTPIILWGITLGNVWSKDVDFEQNAETIFEIKAKMKEKAVYGNFISEWFEIADENGIQEILRKAGKNGVRFSQIDEKLLQLEREIERKINEIK